MSFYFVSVITRDTRVGVRGEVSCAFALLFDVGAQREVSYQASPDSFEFP